MKKKILYLVVVLGVLKINAQTSTFVAVDTLLNRGRYHKAIELLEKFPDSFEKNVKKAQINENLDQQSLVSLHYEKALAFQDDYAIKVKLANSYKKEKKYRKAITVYEKLHEEDKDNLFIAYELGKLHLTIKEAEKALQLFKGLIERDITNANYYYYKGIAYKLLGKRNLRMDSFLEAYEKDDKHIKSIENLAYDYTVLRDADSASIFIKKGLQINPNHIELNKLEINALYRDKNYNKAIELLQKIDTIEPNEHYTKKMLGRCYFLLKDFEIARKYFKQALRIDKTDYKVYTYFGDMDFEEEDYKEAHLHYRMATFIGKESRDDEYYRLAQTLEKLNRTKEALTAYENALRENYKNYKALYQLATLSEHYYKDKKNAYKHYKNYIDRFESKDSVLTNQVTKRLKEIKKFYFQKGEILE